MLANFGFGSLVIAFVISLYGIGAAAYAATGPATQRRYAWAESARSAMLLTFPLITLAALSLITSLVTHDYQLQYVFNVSSNSMPTYLRVTALWGGQAGSLVFWSWLMAAFASAVTLRRWDRDREFLPWVIVVSLVTLAFFLALILFVENPFTRFWQTANGGQIISLFQPAGTSPLHPADGRGLNPLLRHPGMIIHPPMLYLGFVAFVIPFAFAIAALVTGRSDDRWIRVTRRWTLVAWLFLSLGLILGSRWAYDVLGWGGYWGWDPVEIAAFMPWLSGTAFLHSVMIQEKQGMFKRWNMVLIILTYILVIVGTFLTRSGVLSSVHAFAQSAIGPLFFGFIAITAIVSLGLLLHRWTSLHAEGEMHSLLSREALFLFNNLLFMSILAVCLWGVFYPLISELFTGEKVTMGPPFYERATGPMFGALLLLMGIAPLSAWGQRTGKMLGKAIWKPVLVSLVVPVVLLITGMRSWPAVLGFWLLALVICVTVYDTARAVAARGRSKGENALVALGRLAARNRRRYGGYIIHLGVVLMALGIIGIELFQTQTQAQVQRGQALSLDGYSVLYQDLQQWDHADGRNVARATVMVSRDGQSLGSLHPRRDFYYESQQSMTIPGVRSTWEDDLYVLLVDWEPISEGAATFKVYHNPLVNWLWLGGLVFIFGTLLAAWPEPEKQPAVAAARAAGGQQPVTSR